MMRGRSIKRTFTTVGAALVLTLGLACYEMKAAQVRLRIPQTEMDCVDVADRVFWREGFVVVPQTTGTNRLYTPHVTRPMGLRWGISVSIDSWDASNRYWQCKYELQALSVDEGCVIQCPLSPQPGFDDITQKMAGLLDAEFRIPDRGGGSTDR